MIAVRVTPNAPWDTPNLTATVVDGKDTYNDVPVRQYTGAPADVPVNKTNCPIVFLNEMPLPNHKNSIDTQTDTHFDEVRLGKRVKSITVDIIRNVAWPNGVIVLPK